MAADLEKERETDSETEGLEQALAPPFAQAWGKE